MDNLIIENVSLSEIMNGLNTGLYQYNNIENIRITTTQNLSYCIVPVEADVSNSILDFIDSDKDKQKFENQNIILDTTVLDFIVILKDITSEPGKYKISTMSVLELIVAASQLDTETKLFDIDALNFRCIEKNYVEVESELETDMNLLG